MLPILLSLGPVTIYSYGVILSIGLFLAMYWWWKMGRDEHWDEITLFDSFFLSLATFLVAGRLGYVLTHWGDLGTLYRSLALLAFPGLNSVVGILAGVIFVVLFARAQGWDVWKAMDSLVVTLSLILVFGGVGGLLNGSYPGREVSWGLMYPGQSVPRIPVDIWILLWAFLTFLVVSSVRKNFRFYGWYKAEASVVREGLATLVFGMLVGVYFLVAPWLSQPGWAWKGIPLAFVGGCLTLSLSIYLVHRRVGKKTSRLGERLQAIQMYLLQWGRRRRRE